MTNSSYLAFSAADAWHAFWHGQVGAWILTKGLRVMLLLIGAVLAARFINWAAMRVTSRLEAQSGDALVRSEATKHRQAVASVISWVSIVLLFVVVAVQITNELDIPVSSLVAPAAVLGAALGFGAQKLVQDLLAGFFIITERQYGFGDLVQLSMLGAPEEAVGTVEEVTLRVTKLRTADGEVYTVPNGNIVRSLNMSKDWARAVVDIPVPVTADLNRVNEVLHEVGDASMDDPVLKDLLLDQPSLMGVESIGLDNVNLRMVARTLPGKQYDAGRRLRVLVVRALGRAGVVTPTEAMPTVGGLPQTAATGGRAPEEPPPDRRLRIPGRLFGGRIRTSTVALIAAFIGLVWLDQVYEPPPPPEPVQQWVPPGFVPNPDYTWVPRTAVRRPPTTESEPTTTTTTTTTPPADTPTTTPPAVTTPEEPTTTVIDPDGPGLLPPTTVTETDRPDLGVPPTPWGPPTTTTAPAFGPGQQPQNQPPGAARPPGG